MYPWPLNDDTICNTITNRKISKYFKINNNFVLIRGLPRTKFNYFELIGLVHAYDIHNHNDL